MRAAVIFGINQIKIENFPDPTPGEREVVVKVAAVGICGTDLHILEGEFAPTLPIIPGHKMSGEVVALGSKVINGAASVSIVDPNKEKLKTAEILGVDQFGTSANDFRKARGWEVVIDCTGVVPAIKDGLTRVMPGGTFLQFGVASESAKIEIEPFWIYNKEINIIGSMAVLHSFGRAVKLFAAGVIDPQVFISHRFGLNDYKKGLEIFKAGASRKVTIEPNNV